MLPKHNNKRNEIFIVFDTSLYIYASTVHYSKLKKIVELRENNQVCLYMTPCRLLNVTDFVEVFTTYTSKSKQFSSDATETSIIAYPHTRRRIPEDLILYQHSCENLKSCRSVIVVLLSIMKVI